MGKNWQKVTKNPTFFKCYGMKYRLKRILKLIWNIETKIQNCPFVPIFAPFRPFLFPFQ